MICPACKTQMTEITVGEIMVDVCDNGCGGIWFDNYELEKMDEQHESAGEHLLQLQKRPDVEIDHQQERFCPVCEEQKMLQHFMSVKREVTIDECPNCGGIWLDAGELGAIRGQFSTKAERETAADEYFERTIGKDLEKMTGEEQNEQQSARKIKHMFRFLNPSYYLHGKQKWSTQ